MELSEWKLRAMIQAVAGATDCHQLTTFRIELWQQLHLQKKKGEYLIGIVRVLITRSEGQFGYCHHYFQPVTLSSLVVFAHSPPTFSTPSGGSYIVHVVFELRRSRGDAACLACGSHRSPDGCTTARAAATSCRCCPVFLSGFTVGLYDCAVGF